MLSVGWYLCLLLLAGYLFVRQFRPWLRTAKLVLSLPGPSGVPFFANFFQDSDFLKTLGTCYAKYGPIFGGWINMFPFVMILEPKHIQLILGSSKFTDKPFFYDFLHNFLGDGLITNAAPKWKSHRKSIQPYFNLNIIEKFIPTFVKYSKVFVEEEKYTAEIKITSAVNKCIFDMLHQVVLGIPSNHVTTNEPSPFNQGEKTFIRRVLEPWLFAEYIYSFTKRFKREIEQKNSLCGFARNALSELKTKRRNNETSKWSLMECFLEISENNPDFSEEDIVNEACTFMLAGQDSVSAAVSFTLYYLAKYQDIQEKVIQEQNEILLHSNEINMGTLNEMKYLEQCIKESMRMSPSVPLFARVLAEDIRIGKYVIPAGCFVGISPTATHHLSQFYPNPETFDPEQFSATNMGTRHPFAYIPFSAGPRNCIGYKLAMLEMKTFISIVLRRYKFYLIPGKENIFPTFRLTLKAKGGIWLKMESRT